MSQSWWTVCESVFLIPVLLLVLSSKKFKNRTLWLLTEGAYSALSCSLLPRQPHALSPYSSPLHNLSKMRPPHILAPSCFNDNFNIILPFKPVSPTWSLLQLSQQTRISHITHAHMSSHAILLHCTMYWKDVHVQSTFITADTHKGLPCL